MLIGERGESLSGGQRQSVASSRALINDPSGAAAGRAQQQYGPPERNALAQAAGRGRRQQDDVPHHPSHGAAGTGDAPPIVIDGGRGGRNGPKDQVVEALRTGLGGTRELIMNTHVANGNGSFSGALVRLPRTVFVRLFDVLLDGEERGKPKVTTGYTGNARMGNLSLRCRGARVLLDLPGRGGRAAGVGQPTVPSTKRCAAKARSCRRGRSRWCRAWMAVS